MICTVSEPPSMSSPDTVAVRLPVVEGVNEKFDAVIVSSAVAELAEKVTSCSRSELPSQVWAWVMVTFTGSASVVAPARVSVKTRSSSPAPMLSCSASMVTRVSVVPSRVTVTM